MILHIIFVEKKSIKKLGKLLFSKKKKKNPKMKTKYVINELHNYVNLEVF